MPPDEMENQFFVKFYRWSQEYFELEINSDFPVLRRFDLAAARWLIQIMNRLNKEDKHLLAKGLLKRVNHAYISSLLNEPSEPREKAIVEWYIKQGTRSFETGERFRFKSMNIGKQMPKRDIQKQLLASVGKKIGKRTECDVPEFLTFDFSLEKATVRTCICIGTPMGDLSYHHELIKPDGERIKGFISILSWLGISGATIWEKVTEDNIDPTLDALFFGCSEFISAVPKLLSP